MMTFVTENIKFDIFVFQLRFQREDFPQNYNINYIYIFLNYA